MKVKICDKCLSKEVINELKEMNIELEIKCIQFCGVGRNKYVAIIDNMPIISENKIEFIEKIKEKV